MPHLKLITIMRERARRKESKRKRISVIITQHWKLQHTGKKRFFFMSPYMTLSKKFDGDAIFNCPKRSRQRRKVLT